MKSIDFDKVARYYDAHVHADFDVAFWVSEVGRRPGACIELMCGTGRLSVPIMRTGRALTCVDYSAGLLDVLRKKVEREQLPARLVEMDVRQLALDSSFDLAFIGFHAFSELVTDEDGLAALRRVRAVLRPGGALLCSLHNPVVRRPFLDGRWHDYGASPLTDSPNEVEVRGRYLLRDRGDLVDGVQTYREIGSDGRMVRELELPMTFRLLEGSKLEALAGLAGFRAALLYGDYGRGVFDPHHSPVLIYELRAE